MHIFLEKIAKEVVLTLSAPEVNSLRDVINTVSNNPYETQMLVNTVRTYTASNYFSSILIFHQIHTQTTAVPCHKTKMAAIN